MGLYVVAWFRVAPNAPFGVRKVPPQKATLSPRLVAAADIQRVGGGEVVAVHWQEVSESAEVRIARKRRRVVAVIVGMLFAGDYHAWCSTKWM